MEMRDLFEALDEGMLGDLVGWAKRKLTGRREKSKQVGPDKWKLNGKVGHWRTVRGSDIFFPDDGGDPVGMPKKMKRPKTALGRGLRAMSRR